MPYEADEATHSDRWEVLRCSEARLRHLLDRNLAGIYRVSWDGTILECNDAFARMLGPFTAADLRGTSIARFYADPAERELILKDLERETAFSAREICLRRSDGSPVWVLSTAMRICLEGGRAELEGTLLDITARKLMTDALRESEARFRAVILTAGSPIICTGPEQRITELNPAAERIFGLRRDDVIGNHYESLFPDIVRAKVRSDLRRVFAGEPITGFENVVTSPGGGTSVVLWDLRPLLDGDGRPHGVVAIGQDITDRQRAAESLMRQARYLRALTATDRAILALQRPEAIAGAVLRHIGALLPCRGAAVIAFDAESGEARLLALAGDPGETHADTRPLRPEDLGCKPRAVAGPEEGSRLLLIPLAVQGESIGLLQIHQRTGQGSVTSAELELAGQVADRLAVALHNWRLYDTARDARRRLETVSMRLVEVQEAERRRLARELHDEIGQVLTGLKLQLEMAGERADPESLARASSIAQQLIQQVRNLSLDLRPAILDDFGLLPALLWHVERYGGMTGVLVQLDHEALDCRFAQGLETAAYRIVQEALTNVARHAGVQTVRVSVRATSSEIQIEIEDRGSGFEPGSLQPSSSTGLSSMRERATLLGGTLTVRSSTGAGTLIRAALPLGPNPGNASCEQVRAS